ncbi:hypothetical protein Q0A17_06210 [Citrobacter sp. S2-9]|uniref:Tape measure protein n=1 Tax=Citrobacter enshiensis TaxID=2971264 RepID=A0ABT8PRN8_9ENTR|nr:hypothetical protein [Citrobacter enshiensis]MDN8599007.1 hypothetical protein [Citrobacter enshiensis]
MAGSQNFKSTVTFGGRVDPSFRRSTEDLQSAIRETGQTVSQLTRRQEKLGTQIKRMKLAGQEVSHLTSQYQRLGREIDSVTDDQERLNRQMARRERLQKWGLRGAAAAKFGGATALGGVVGFGAVAAAATAGALATLEHTTEKAGLAKGYGVGIEKYSAWENIAQRASLNGENMGDLAEELTNKIGEQGNEKTVNPMLAQLNLSKRRMAGWSREKQFDEVMQRLSALKDDRQAASLGDQLMGGEANKLLTMIRASGKSWQELMTQANKNNLLSQEGADGAMRAHIAITNLWGSITSGLEDVLGKVGGELEPAFEEVQNDIIKWFKGNEADWTSSVHDWMKKDESGKTGADRLWDNLKNFGDGVVQVSKVIWAVAEKLSWLIQDDEENKKKITDYVNQGNSYIGAKSLAGDYDLEDWFNKNYTPEKIAEIQAKKNADTTTPEQLASRQSSKPSISYGNYQSPVTITVNAAPGQSAEDVGGSVYDKFKQTQAQPASADNTGAMYDLPGAGG